MTLDTNLSHAVPVQFGNQTVKAIPQADGTYLQIGNTNGNPADAYTWLTWAILNGKAQADPAWAASAALHKWYSDQHYGDSFLNHWLPIAIEATTVAAVSYGFVAAAAGGAAAGGGAAAAAPGATVAPTATFTGTLAAPVTAVDTGLTASTIAPIAFGGATAATAAEGIGGSLMAAASKVLGAPAAAQLAQLLGAVTGAKLADNGTPAAGQGNAPGVSIAKPIGILAAAAGALLLYMVAFN